MTIIPFISSGVGVLPPVPPSTHLVVFTYYTADPAGYNVGLYDPITNELGPVIASGGEPLGKPSWVHDHAHIAIPHFYSGGSVNLLAVDGSDVRVANSGGEWSAGVSSACYTDRIISTTIDLSGASVMFSYRQDGSGGRDVLISTFDTTTLTVRGNRAVDQWKGLDTPAIVNPVSGDIAYSTSTGVRVRSFDGSSDRLVYFGIAAPVGWAAGGVDNSHLYVQASDRTLNLLVVYNDRALLDHQWILPTGVEAGPAEPMSPEFTYVAFDGSNLQVYTAGELMHEIVTPADVLIGADWYWGAS